MPLNRHLRNLGNIVAVLLMVDEEFHPHKPLTYAWWSFLSGVGYWNKKRLFCCIAGPKSGFETMAAERLTLVVEHASQRYHRLSTTQISDRQSSSTSWLQMYEFYIMHFLNIPIVAAADNYLPSFISRLFERISIVTNVSNSFTKF